SVLRRNDSRSLSFTRGSSSPISTGVNASIGVAVGAARLSIVNQKTRQLRMQNTDIKLASRWAVLSLDSSALQPDLTILWNSSIFHLNPYHSSFSIASWRD